MENGCLVRMNLIGMGGRPGTVSGVPLKGLKEVQCLKKKACAIHACIHPPTHPSFHVQCYNPFWAMASLKRHLLSSLFPVYLLWPLYPRTCIASPWTISSQIVLGFPVNPVFWIFPLRNFFWGFFHLVFL
jgi:hypothetical protein